MMTLKDAISTVYLDHYRSMVPDMVLRALRLIDRTYTAGKSQKGFTLSLRKRKKGGDVLYVRYWHNGRMIPSKWNTYTSNYDAATEYAVKNRDKLISLYEEKNGNEVIRFFNDFYDTNNLAYQSECMRNGPLTEVRRIRFRNVIINDFIPFLQKKHIQTFESITVSLLDDFQDILLRKGIKSRTVNEELLAVGKVLKYLARKGKVKSNPYLELSRITEKEHEKKTHGCYEVEKLKGVFDKPWDNDIAYLLNLIIHTTGLRNSEIKRISKKDIVNIDGCWFIELKKSKTESGKRLVPIHDFVYGHIIRYAKARKDAEEIFADISQRQFDKAGLDMADRMGVSEEYLIQNNITFYSGRHFWKTLMNAGGLGDDIEEILMGHKVTGNVAKLYNHRDKQGKELLVKKAKEVFKILDTKLFNNKKISSLS